LPKLKTQEAMTTFAEDWSQGTESLMQKLASAGRSNDGRGIVDEATERQEGRSVMRIDPKSNHAHACLCKALL
jgi:hypothetical protein